MIPPPTLSRSFLWDTCSSRSSSFAFSSSSFRCLLLSFNETSSCMFACRLTSFLVSMGTILHVKQIIFMLFWESRKKIFNNKLRQRWKDSACCAMGAALYFPEHVQSMSLKRNRENWHLMRNWWSRVYSIPHSHPFHRAPHPLPPLPDAARFS